MTRIEVLNDNKFVSACLDLGLNCKDFEIYGDIIAVNTPRKDVVALFDKHYNLIGVPKVDYNNPKEAIEKEIAIYNKNESPEYYISYPFTGFSIRDLINLSDRIWIHITNNGHSGNMIVNWEEVNDDYTLYTDLLGYIKFLGEQAKEYYKHLYQMRMMGYDYPDAYRYLRSIMFNIDLTIDRLFSEGIRPYPHDIIKNLGQNRSAINKYEFELYHVVDLFLKTRGYELKRSLNGYGKVIPTERSYENTHDLAMKLLKLLEISDEEVNERNIRTTKNMMFDHVNLEELIATLNQEMTLRRKEGDEENE